jgi:hypothetical protein
MNHTKEPWKADLRLGCFAIYPDSEDRNCLGGANDDAVVYQSGRGEESSPNGYKYLTEEQEANAHRIVQCVNACADMEDPAKEIAQLRADRAELLYVLQDVTASLRSKVMFDGNYLADAVNKSLGTANDLIKRMEANHE